MFGATHGPFFVLCTRDAGGMLAYNADNVKSARRWSPSAGRKRGRHCFSGLRHRRKRASWRMRLKWGRHDCIGGSRRRRDSLPYSGPSAGRLFSQGGDRFKRPSAGRSYLSRRDSVTGLICTGWLLSGLRRPSCMGILGRNLRNLKQWLLHSACSP